VLRVTDLKVLAVAIPELEAAVETFRKSFGLPVTRSSGEAGGVRSVRLGIGAAEIEMSAPTGAGTPLADVIAERGAGLHELVLEVEDVGAAREALDARAIAFTSGADAAGRPLLRLEPTATHGVRITLIGR
jgi:glyoxalase/bleomycin resistance protein/dioxygenase superfamily protein